MNMPTKLRIGGAFRHKYEKKVIGPSGKIEYIYPEIKEMGKEAETAKTKEKRREAGRNVPIPKPMKMAIPRN